MMAKIRVLLADDHTVLRSGLRMLIEAQSDMEVVGEAGDCAATIALAESARPDLITLDLKMPGGTGLATLATLRATVPSARVLVLSMYDDPAYVRSALAAGASGYLVKSVAAVALMGAIRAVHRGRLCIEVGSAEAAESFVKPPAAVEAPSPLGELSSREREVLIMVAQGHTNRAIAERLRLSTKTVESYRSRLMQKLGLGNRAELTHLVLELGLLGDSPDGISGD